MRAAFYNPYLDTLGGGERYTLLFAKALHELGYMISLEWSNEDTLKRAEKKFGHTFDFIKIIDDLKKGEGFDLLFWVSDGSIPLLHSRKNILHFQIPFTNVNGSTLFNKMKLYRIKEVICNSDYTKKFIDKEYALNCKVVYPPVDVGKIRPLKKENIILYVGRFSELTQSKRQDVLIDVFKRMQKKGYGNWKLVLAGGSEVGADKNLEKLKEMVDDYPIKIIENPSFKELVHLYGRSKYFWSAVGYDVDPKKDPQKMEHFGITVVEAMAGGCVPIIYNGGGYDEIVTDGLNGKFWSKRSGLLKLTIDLIENKKEYEIISSNAVKRSEEFGYERFKKEVEEIVG